MANDEVFEKVQKLLKLSEGTSSINEANSALEKAHAILKANGLTMAELNDNASSNEAKKSIAKIDASYLGNMPRKWKIQIMIGACEANYCKLVKVSGQYCIFGKEVNVKTVNILGEYLISTVESLSKKIDSTHRTNYCQGAASSLYTRLMELIEQDNSESDSRALVVQETKNISKALEKIFGGLNTKTTTIESKNDSAFFAGFSDGSNISFNKQIA